jgi:GNAT superfamily N-acetyltransferase
VLASRNLSYGALLAGLPMKPASEITVRELKPELAQEYVEFFDEIYDSDPWLKSEANPWWGGCYCSSYDSLRAEDVGTNTLDKASQNRIDRLERIKKGKASGLLAYAGGKVIGWCNVAPRDSYVNLRHFEQAVTDPGEHVGSITCFVVSSEYRKSGVATKLLQSACDIIRGWGLPIAEGYPWTPKDNPNGIPQDNLNFRGSLNLFLRSGFQVHMKFERFTVVRKAL